MTTVIFLISLLLSPNVQTGSIGIYETYADYKAGTPSITYPGFIKIKPKKDSYTLFFKDKNGKKISLPLAGTSYWGFTNGEQDYRFDANMQPCTLWKIEDHIKVYSDYTGYAHQHGEEEEFIFQKAYLSADLESEIMPITRENVRKLLAEDAEALLGLDLYIEVGKQYGQSADKLAESFLFGYLFKRESEREKNK